MSQGNVILLNGTSSAGKSSMAKALQQIMDTPCLHTGLDHFLSGMSSCGTVSDGEHPAESDYFLLVYTGGTRDRLLAVQRGEEQYADGALADVRIGPGAVSLLRSMYAGIAAMAAAGLDVIVDDVIHDRRVLRVAVEELKESNVLFVGLFLPREVAERRERERGDRGPGGATAFFDKVHAHGVYDLELNTSTASAEACARRIKVALEDGTPRRAIRELAATFDA